jgi:hypothetical protein
VLGHRSTGRLTPVYFRLTPVYFRLTPVYFLKRLSRSTPPSLSILSTAPPFGVCRSASFSGESRFRSHLRSSQPAFDFRSLATTVSLRLRMSPYKRRQG